MSTIYVNSEPTLSKLIGDLRGLWREHKYLRISIKAGKDRSLDQNAILHAWINQIATELREQTAAEVKAECKLTIGVPILRAEDEEFRQFYDKSIKLMTYEDKLHAMSFCPVTSLMTVKQLSQFLTGMQETYRKRGVELEFPAEAE